MNMKSLFYAKINFIIRSLSLKKLLFLLLISSSVFAKFQTVSIGTIDKEYQNILSKEQIYTILMQIQEQFKTQLGYDVFAYKKDGKPINIVYLKPSIKKRKIIKNNQELIHLKEKISKLQIQREKEQLNINQEQKELNKKYRQYNKKVNALNSYIKRINDKNKNGLNKDEYNKVKIYTSVEQKKIKRESKRLKREKKQFHKDFNRLKQRTTHYNYLVQKYNRLIRDTQDLSKNFIEVKGITTGQIKTTYTSTQKNGKKSMSKHKDITMDKIEIYDFETLAKFKVVLAHELGHLVGVEHIHVQGALMNPFIQDNQVQELFLTPLDILEFNKVFQKRR